MKTVRQDVETRIYALLSGSSMTIRPVLHECSAADRPDPTVPIRKESKTCWVFVASDEQVFKCLPPFNVLSCQFSFLAQAELLQNRKQLGLFILHVLFDFIDNPHQFLLVPF